MGKRKGDLRDPPNNLRRLDRGPNLDSQVEPVCPGALLGVGSFTLDLKHSVRGKNERYWSKFVNETPRRKCRKEGLPVGYIGKRLYIPKSFSLTPLAGLDVTTCLAGSISSVSLTGPGLMLNARDHL